MIRGDYPRPLPPPRLLLLLPLLDEPDEPEERDGGDAEEPRELLPEEFGVTLLGLDVRAGVALGLEEEAGRAAGRVVLEGRVVEAGLVPWLPEGRVVVPDGRTPWLPAGLVARVP